MLNLEIRKLDQERKVIIGPSKQLMDELDASVADKEILIKLGVKNHSGITKINKERFKAIKFAYYLKELLAKKDV